MSKKIYLSVLLRLCIKVGYCVGKDDLLLYDKSNAGRYLEKGIKANPEHKRAKALLGQL
ncbi:hypothetical protein [Chitinophaga sp. Ak27]|uniref:hypothetical protein n=1 Tax=Chitinophaga sp. Ak27 TaxID=2726116 RepID=UPI00145E5F8F|nr:hypothetical protein [Chitinophaga sp. Ak27]NLU92004.1 hypothetical protein [Chitinophaga sp. Ak27]